MLQFKIIKSLSRRFKGMHRSGADRRRRERRLGLSEDLYQGVENRSALRRTKTRR